MSELKNRIDFVYIFDVQDGNPNGDPDAGNLPRIDAETGIGLVTDVCLKRKVRNYVQIAQAGKAGNDILVKSKEISGEEVFINEEIRKMYKEDLGIELKIKEKAPADKSSAGKIAMCRRFFDVRTFGAVLSTGPNAGQVRGPIQMTFARSQDMIVSAEHALTVCVARDEEKTYESQVGIQGRKATIPYGLYVCHGFISANLAQQTGFSEEDLELFWEALKNMFDVDRSAARGLMSAQKLIVFKHDSILGNAPANKLFELVKVEKVCDEEKTYESQVGIQGRKATIPYGLYVCHGFISANLAQQTGFSEEDLELFWEALKNMFDVDRSAARGLMSAQKLIVFKHDSILGNAPANKLFELVKVEKVCDGAPRSFIDYSVTIDKENAPSNVTIEELI